MKNVKRYGSKIYEKPGQKLQLLFSKGSEKQIDYFLLKYVYQAKINCVILTYITSAAKEKGRKL